MTGQDLLNLVEVSNNELQCAVGEPDCDRALLALNIAQDYLESFIARMPDLLGDSTGTIVTATNTESTPFPVGLLRLDKLQLLDSTTLRPIRDLEPLYQTGSHAGGSRWPWGLASGTTPLGATRSYWTNGRSIFWAPPPDAVYSIRWYGLQAVADITAISTFLYPDIAAFPLASFAAAILKASVDDSTLDLLQLADRTFSGTVSTFGSFNRTGAEGLVYTETHIT